MNELRNSVCIVGVDESDELGTLPHKSQLTLHVEAVRNAVRDAGLEIGDGTAEVMKTVIARELMGRESRPY